MDTDAVNLKFNISRSISSSNSPIYLFNLSLYFNIQNEKIV